MRVLDMLICSFVQAGLEFSNRNAVLRIITVPYTNTHCLIVFVVRNMPVTLLRLDINRSIFLTRLHWILPDQQAVPTHPHYPVVIQPKSLQGSESEILVGGPT